MFPNPRFAFVKFIPGVDFILKVYNKFILNADRTTTVEYLCGAAFMIKKSVLDLTLDDGKETIRAAVFDKVAEQILGLTADEAAKINMEMGDNSAAIKRQMSELGKKREILADGRAKWNERNKRLEFVISSLIKIHPKNELEANLNELENKIV